MLCNTILYTMLYNFFSPFILDLPALSPGRKSGDGLVICPLDGLLLQIAFPVVLL